MKINAYGNMQLQQDKAFYLEHLKKVLLRFWLKHGIDYEYGGFYTCFDNSGKRLLSTEALYTLLLAGTLTGDGSFTDLYGMVHDYTFRIFPNPDKETGEWIQIRDRQGNPENKFVALPVKDPFHIIRNIILIIELLDGLENKKQIEDILT